MGETSQRCSTASRPPCAPATALPPQIPTRAEQAIHRAVPARSPSRPEDASVESPRDSGGRSASCRGPVRPPVPGADSHGSQATALLLSPCRVHAAVRLAIPATCPCRLPWATILARGGDANGSPVVQATQIVDDLQQKGLKTAIFLCLGAFSPKNFKAGCCSSHA